MTDPKSLHSHYNCHCYVRTSPFIRTPFLQLRSQLPISGPRSGGLVGAAKQGWLRGTRDASPYRGYRICDRAVRRCRCSPQHTWRREGVVLLSFKCGGGQHGGPGRRLRRRVLHLVVPGVRIRVWSQPLLLQGMCMWASACRCLGGFCAGDSFAAVCRRRTSTCCILLTSYQRGRCPWSVSALQPVTPPPYTHTHARAFAHLFVQA